MTRTCAIFLLALCLLAVSVSALADDADLAAKLVGNWEGQWEYGQDKGKLTLKITAAKGNAVDGETKWFGTVAGDVPDHFKDAKLKNRQLKAFEETMNFVVTVSEDGTSMEGKWANPYNATGPIRLKKVE